MKTLILFASMSMALATISSPALMAVNVSVGDQNIAVTNVLDDLKTDKAFALTYETVYPCVASLGTDIYGNTVSDWQGITAAPVSDFKQTYFYFYHPTCSAPKWISASDGSSSFDVTFRVSMAVTGSLDTYSHYDLTLVNHSSDKRFWKFRCDTSFYDQMQTASYRAYEISEFEVMKADGLGGSNAYNVGKRFSWTKGTDGVYTSKSSNLQTIELKPTFDYFRIHGKNGHDTPQDALPKIAEYSVSNNNGTITYVKSSTPASYDYKCAFTDVFYVYFPVAKTYGSLVGADMTYDIHNALGTYGLYDTLDTIFDSNFYSKIQGNFVDEPTNTLWFDASEKKNLTGQKIRLSTGDDKDYVGLETLTTDAVENQYPAGPARWWNDREAWCLGYADSYTLATAQKLTPIDGSNFVKDPSSSTSYDHPTTNPYAIGSETNNALKAAYDSGKTLLSDYYVLRYEMRDAELFGRQRATGTIGASKTEYILHHWDVIDADIMDLHFYKNGIFYTIGVVANSGDTITGGELPKATTSFSFNWKWLLVILGGIGIIGLIWFAASTISKLVGGSNDD